jgi:hypothetical protein
LFHPVPGGKLGRSSEDPMRGGLLTIALLLALGTAPRAEEPRGLFEIRYDLLLADYCALLDAGVVAGYRAEALAAIARDGLDPAAQSVILSRAEIAFEREWGNRGLGGSRPWCRNEGAVSAARLAAKAP